MKGEVVIEFFQTLSLKDLSACNVEINGQDVTMFYPQWILYLSRASSEMEPKYS